MLAKHKKDKEREKEAALKALREEIAAEIAEQLPIQRQAETSAIERVGAAVSNKLEIQDEEEAKRIVEAILFAASKPVTVSDLKRAVIGFSASQIEKLVAQLRDEYAREGRSFRIQEIAGGYECSTEPRFAPWITQVERERQLRHATQSALETLAILAYKQPVARAEVEDLRGVDVSGVLGTLLERDLIKIVGRKEVPGRPFLYGTTEKFLAHFGLKSLEDLPNISEIKELVENSVNREALLRTEKIVSVEDGEFTAQKESVEPMQPVVEST